MDNNIFYTYAYLREDLTPYYIGKGKSYRAYRKNRNVHPPEDKNRILFLKKNLTEKEAFKHEIYMISVFGRKDLGTGILHNRTNGGDGTSGAILSQETKDKIGNDWRGRKRPGQGEKTIDIQKALNYALSGKAQSIADDLGYVPLSGSILNKSRIAVKRIGQ